MYSGEIVPLEYVRSGDVLMSPYSTPRRVESVERMWGPLYRVTPAKGMSYVATTLSVRESRREFRVQTLSGAEWLAATPNFRQRHVGWRVAVDFLPGVLLADAYEVGARRKPLPHAYRVACRADRLQTLAGMIDAGGFQAAYAGYTFRAPCDRVMDDAVFLARSLGFAMYPTGSGRCHIAGEVGRIPCRLPHKRSYRKHQYRCVLHTGLRVEPLGKGEWVRLGVGEYVAGDFTVRVS